VEGGLSQLTRDDVLTMLRKNVLPK